MSVSSGGLQRYGDETRTIASVLGGSYALTKVGAGVLTLLGNNVHSGTTTILSGILKIGNGGATGRLGSGAIVNNSTLEFNVNVVTPFPYYSLASTNLISGSGNVVINSPVTSPTWFQLQARNTYTGGTIVNGGLQISHDTPRDYSPVGSGPVLINPTGTLFLMRINPLNDMAAGILPTINLNGGKLSQISYGGSGSIYKDPINLLADSTIEALGNNNGTTNGAGFNITSIVNINDKTLTFVNVGANFNNSQANITGTGNVVYNGNGVNYVLFGNGANTYTGSTTINNGAIALIGSNATPFGPTTAAGVTVNPGGEMRLQGSNTATSPTVFLNGGKIRTVTSSSWNNPIVLTASSTIEYTGGGGFNLSGAGTVNIGTHTLTIINTAGLLNFLAPLSGSGNILIPNTSTLDIRLSAANTLSGTITVNGGRLSIGGGTFNPFGTATPTFNNSIFDLNSSRDTPYLGTVFLNNASVWNSSNSFARWASVPFVLGTGTTNTLKTFGNGSLTVGPISGAGNVVIENVNPVRVVAFGGANTYTGTTDVNSGILSISSPSQLYNGNTANWTNTNIKVASGSKLLIGLSATNVTSVNLDVLKTLGSATRGFQTGSTLAINAASTQTYASAITNTDFGGNIVNIQKTNAGTLILTGNNSYPGTTTIDATGVLQIGNGAASGTLGTGNVINNGTLTFFRSDAITVANNISGIGALPKIGNNTMTLTGNNSYTGPTNINDGTLVIASATALGTGAVTVNNGGTLTYTADTTGTRTVTVNAGGVVNLGGFAHVGTVFVNAGGTINP